MNRLWIAGLCAAYAAALAVAACGGGANGGSQLAGVAQSVGSPVPKPSGSTGQSQRDQPLPKGSYPASSGSPQPVPTPTPGPIHINYFSGGGSIVSGGFGTVSGFTQMQRSQVLGLSPGTKVIITNVDTAAHTLNVYGDGYPNPNNVTITQQGGTTLQPGYQTGILNPGQSTGVLTVGAGPGNWFIVCGIHYQFVNPFMQDGLVVQVGATPGPQATPDPSPAPSSSPKPSPTNSHCVYGCGGY